MDIRAIQQLNQLNSQKTTLEQKSKQANDKKESNDTGKVQSVIAEAAVVFEKSSETSVSINYSNTAQEKLSEVDRLKLQVDQKMNSAFYMMVKETLNGQNAGMKAAIEQILSERADEITPEMVEEAKADTEEGGFFSPESVAERILDFAKALSGNNNEKSDLLKDAFIKGFEEVEEIWGDELPEISQKTYDLVMDGFDAWKNEGSQAEVSESEGSASSAAEDGLE